ncbi:MAG: hypothetical protein HRU75_06780 [Planctomycetia bacterium]|nr:MAG: hypothetical protein HRU75_06780 [Planctomycetia bacterium]
MPRRLRRAAMYVLVLGAATIVMIVGMSGLLAARIGGREAVLVSDFAAARANAYAAMQVGLLIIEQHSEWRGNFSTGQFFSPTPIGDGTMALTGIDPRDGDIANSDGDPLLLTASGAVRDARYHLQVLLSPTSDPIEVLRTAVHCGNKLTINSGVALRVNGAPASTNNEAALSGNIAGDLHAASRSGSGNVSGTTTIPAPEKPVPGANVIATYASRATAIPAATKLDKVVLGPGINPFGIPNPNGLYVISTGGASIEISNTRVFGTLVINAGGGTVYIRETGLFEAAGSSRPALLINGHLEIVTDPDQAGLVEAALDTNFNPPGAPYAGVSDSDKEDFYTSALRGLIHVTGNVRISGPIAIRGVLLAGGEVRVEADVTIDHDSKLVDSPPEGYDTPGPLSVTSGAWRQVVD